MFGLLNSPRLKTRGPYWKRTQSKSEELNKICNNLFSIKARFILKPFSLNIPPSMGAHYTTQWKSYPLCVTRHWRSPSFLKISTVMSMGVWSVTVKGLRSMMPRRRRGGGASGGWAGQCSVKTTREALTMPSWRFRALSDRRRRAEEIQMKSSLAFQTKCFTLQPVK